MSQRIAVAGSDLADFEDYAGWDDWPHYEEDPQKHFLVHLAHREGQEEGHHHDLQAGHQENVWLLADARQQADGEGSRQYHSGAEAQADSVLGVVFHVPGAHFVPSHVVQVLVAPLGHVPFAGPPFLVRDHARSPGAREEDYS